MKKPHVRRDRRKKEDDDDDDDGDIMPATATSGRVAQPVYKYELPTLEFKLGSLTEGTDIPPPLPSPVAEEPTPPQTPPSTSIEADANQNKNSDKNESPHSDAHGPKTPTPPATTSTKTRTPAVAAAAAAADTSPTMTRTGSMRRLFSRGLLHGDGAASASASATGPSSHGPGCAAVEADSIKRPESRATMAGMGLDFGRKAKRSSGWFGRLRSGSGEAKRLGLTMTMTTETAAPPVVVVPSGPPPPRIPELSELKSKVDVDDQGSLGGGDLFKDIK